MVLCRFVDVLAGVRDGINSKRVGITSKNGCN